MLYRKTDAGILVTIEVKPNSKKDSISVKKRKIRVYTTSPPAHGHANRSIIRIIEDYFGVPAEIKSGSARRQKEIILKGITEEDFQGKIK